MASTNKPAAAHGPCVLCCQEVDVFALGKCDHPVCFLCSTKMRVLSEQPYCAVCRLELAEVVFTHTFAPFASFDTSRMTIDREHGICFDCEGTRDKYRKLLLHACPRCPALPPFSTLQELQKHMKQQHERFPCDLCLRHLKIFSRERRWYTRKELAHHRRTGDPDDRSHRGHPLCQFCDQRYLDNDELLKHLRRDHFYCHFCDAEGTNEYYSDYNFLREHFRAEHFLCEEGPCQGQEFVNAFRTDIDLRAHRASVHSRNRAEARQTRQLELQFTCPLRRHLRNDGVVTNADFEDVERDTRNRGPPRRPRPRENRDEGRELVMALRESLGAQLQHQQQQSAVAAAAAAAAGSGAEQTAKRYSPSGDGDSPERAQMEAEVGTRVAVTGDTAAKRVALAAGQTVSNGPLAHDEFPALGAVATSASSASESAHARSNMAAKMHQSHIRVFDEEFPSLTGSTPAFVPGFAGQPCRTFAPTQSQPQSKPQPKSREEEFPSLTKRQKGPPLRTQGPPPQGPPVRTQGPPPQGPPVRTQGPPPQGPPPQAQQPRPQPKLELEDFPSLTKLGSGRAPPQRMKLQAKARGNARVEEGDEEEEAFPSLQSLRKGLLPTPDPQKRPPKREERTAGIAEDRASAKALRTGPIGSAPVRETARSQAQAEPQKPQQKPATLSREDEPSTLASLGKALVSRALAPTQAQQLQQQEPRKTPQPSSSHEERPYLSGVQIGSRPQAPLDEDFPSLPTLSRAEHRIGGGLPGGGSGGGGAARQSTVAARAFKEDDFPVLIGKVPTRPGLVGGRQQQRGTGGASAWGSSGVTAAATAAPVPPAPSDQTLKLEPPCFPTSSSAAAAANVAASAKGEKSSKVAARKNRSAAIAVMKGLDRDDDDEEDASPAVTSLEFRSAPTLFDLSSLLTAPKVSGKGGGKKQLGGERADENRAATTTAAGPVRAATVGETKAVAPEAQPAADEASRAKAKRNKGKGKAGAGTAADEKGAAGSERRKVGADDAKDAGGRAAEEAGRSSDSESDCWWEKEWEEPASGADQTNGTERRTLANGVPRPPPGLAAPPGPPSLLLPPPVQAVSGFLSLEDDFPALTAPAVPRKPPPGFVKSGPVATAAAVLKQPPPGLGAPATAPPGFGGSTTSIAPPGLAAVVAVAVPKGAPPGLVAVPAALGDCREGEVAGGGGAGTGYIAPENFVQRNRSLIDRVRGILGEDEDKFTDFKKLSGQFRQGSLSAIDYHARCEALLGPVGLGVVLPELLVLLPDTERQRQLLDAHGQRRRRQQQQPGTGAVGAARKKKGQGAKVADSGSELDCRCCPSCQQVVGPADWSWHTARHGGEDEFPALPSAARSTL